jgi:hypothetical protein
MGKTEINPVVAIVAGVLILAVIVFFGYRATQPPTPARGSYTPGVPPWLDKNNPNKGSNHMPPVPPGAPGAPSAPAPAPASGG